MKKKVTSKASRKIQTETKRSSLSQPNLTTEGYDLSSAPSPTAVETENPSTQLSSPTQASESHSEKTPEERLAKLELENKRLWARNAALNSKFFALHQAVVESSKLTSCELGSSLAEIFPVELKKDSLAPTTVVAFGSMGANFGLPPKQFFNAFRDKPAEIVFAKDFKQIWYQQGLLGLSKDIETTATVLEQLCKPRRQMLSMVGASSGGFAAILFGVLLGADRIVAFSPQTKITERVFNRFKTDDSSVEDITFASRYCDLFEVLSKIDFKGTIDIYYSNRADFDSAEAMYLSTIPYVRLRPITWNGHNTAHVLKVRGQLDPIINYLCDPTSSNPS